LDSLVSLSTSGQDTGQDQVLIIFAYVRKLGHKIFDQSFAQVNLIGVHGQQGVVASDRATVT
jgi:hypothetical protein